MALSKKSKSKIVRFFLMFVNFLLIRYFLLGYLLSTELSLKDGLITSLCYAIAFFTLGFAKDYLRVEEDYM